MQDASDALEEISDMILLETLQNTPLILDLNGDGVKTTAVDSKGATYSDHNGDGFAEASGWVTGGDGLLVMDVNKNGLIDSGKELFGDQTGKANGFLVLKQYDGNEDSKISAEDAVWRNLKVWVDANGDGLSSNVELKTLDQLKISAINLAYNDVNLTNNGNNIKQNGTFVINGATRTVSDVYFSVDKVNSVYDQDFDLNEHTWILPHIRGYGTLPDLHIAMSLDNTATSNLLSKVQALAAKTFDTIFTADKTIPDLVRGILYRWAGVEGVAAGSRGPNVDAKELAFLEKLMGQGFTQRNYYANPGPLAGKGLAEAFDLAYDAFYARLLAQGAGKALFAGDVRYNLATDALEGITGLSTASLDALKAEAKGLGTSAARAALWENAVRLVEFGYGVATLGAAHRTALDNAIKSSDATLSLAKVLAVLHPENGDKVLSGGIGDDIITTGTGNDVIDAHAGNDVIRTGAGNDRIFGGIDVWNELGGGGNDTMTGGTGDDFIDGYDGNDLYLYALGDGRDTYTDASGADRIVLGAGITAANLAFNRAGDARSAIWS